jgi:hypothetical protein
MKENDDYSNADELTKIRIFLQKLGFQAISDLSSTNQIYSKNGNIIIVKERE